MLKSDSEIINGKSGAISGGGPNLRFGGEEEEQEYKKRKEKKREKKQVKGVFKGVELAGPTFKVALLARSPARPLAPRQKNLGSDSCFSTPPRQFTRLSHQFQHELAPFISKAAVRDTYYTETPFPSTCIHKTHSRSRGVLGAGEGVWG